MQKYKSMGPSSAFQKPVFANIFSKQDSISTAVLCLLTTEVC